MMSETKQKQALAEEQTEQVSGGMVDSPQAVRKCKDPVYAEKWHLHPSFEERGALTPVPGHTSMGGLPGEDTKGFEKLMWNIRRFFDRLF